ncbi:DUF4010 domain-containing protein [Phenylobacterium sp.]|uniref:MgtC/SapB family protein n=1 Tax=Phenylobacterium sp. TaxID=1871053 RepID=UPI00286AF050|nr:DUF4010 domain-containing protein [Phenylobacterium sp.]
MPLELFNRLGLALAIGFLVGVERGWRARDVADGRRTAGIRTYALTGLLGGVAALLGQSLGGWAFAALGLPFAAAFILFKHREQEEDGDYSVTAIVAALLVFALGALAVIGDGRIAAATAVVATGLLAFKGLLHSWLERLTWPELRSALILLAMTLVALPLLPNRGFGPFDSVNPYELWLLTIAMAGVSFVAYGAIKTFGPSRGLVLASLAGAVVSSTATTLHLARLNRQAPDQSVMHAAAALLAGAVMAVRLGVVTAVLAPALFQRLVLPLGVFAALSSLLGLGGALIRPSASTGASPMKSPFDLAVVLKFALVLGAVMAAARILSALYGAGGLLPVAALAGLADVDAVTLAVARMTTEEGLSLDLGVYAVLLAAAVDSASKTAIATLIGGRRFGGTYGAGTLLAATAAAAAVHWGGAAF